MSLPWLLFGAVGAVVSFTVALAQLNTWRRARRLRFDEAAYGRTREQPDARFHTAITPLKVYTEPLAVRGVGLPLACVGTAVFVVFSVVPSVTMWVVCGALAIGLAPLRRALNLRVVSVIARTVRFPDGALCDRDGTPVAEQRWPDLFTAWYRHEYARPAANDDPSSTVLTKFWWLCGHLLAWPVTLPATQLVHTAMCQNPAWALGHTGDDAPGARWQRDLAQARPPDKSAKSAKSVKRNRVRNGAAPPDAPSG